MNIHPKKGQLLWLSFSNNYTIRQTPIVSFYESLFLKWEKATEPSASKPCASEPASVVQPTGSPMPANPARPAAKRLFRLFLPDKIVFHHNFVVVSTHYPTKKTVL